MKKLIILFFILTQALCVFAQANREEYINISFWEKFKDENLVSNLLLACQNNNDIKAATLKVAEAQKVVKMSFADELPYIGFEGYVGRIFKSSDEVFGSITIPNYAETHYYLPLTMNYEIDIWGKNHLKTKSKKKQFEIVEQDERAAYIYLTSALAVDYYNLIRCDKLIEYQKKLIALQKEVVNSYEIRYKYGTATLTEIDDARKTLSYMEEDLNRLFEKQDVIKNQISVLLADRAFEDIARSNYDNIDIQFKAPEGIDFELLGKRPDRIKTELDLERIGIDTKVARREFLPKFILTGNLGFNMYNIQSPHTFLANLGIAPVWDIFSGGRKWQNLKIKKDEYEIAVQKYEKAILSSIQETNDALYSFKTAEKINAIAHDRLNTDARELEYTKIKEDAGTADNLDLILDEEKLIISKKQSTTSDINRIIAAINLYQALGGVDFIENL